MAPMAADRSTGSTTSSSFNESGLAGSRGGGGGSRVHHDFPNFSDNQQPLVVKDHPQVQPSNETIQSRICYRWVFGGAHHFGYWERDTWWPFPLSPHLSTMQDKLFEALDLPPDARVLDAGCGQGHVALHMAKKGIHVTAIDISERHVHRAQRRMASAGLSGQATVRRMDFHHLETVLSQSHDGIYTMETLVHSTDPESVIASFYRILKPGGRYVLHEYGRRDPQVANQTDAHMQVHAYNLREVKPMLPRGLDLYKQMLEDAGFVDVVVIDLSENIKPMLRYLYLLTAVPAFFSRLLGLQDCFGVDGGPANNPAQLYNSPEFCRYVQISATKPLNPKSLARR
ncbi:S-adenosyl-L-methionine-dependent methyltransferase [Podospora didyma]|uniref:S-adenosyl-L-methionine-dependent methyltransferase n=1 Tax=Podospora didyma TaxID=330526 RepID=A0AAE0NX76_9PEZI|nr:S-adenosyl-L-methionine-dependent methyltransferase [Podospora didyma]